MAIQALLTGGLELWHRWRMDTDQDNIRKVSRLRELVREGENSSAVDEVVEIVLGLVFAEQSREERRQVLDVARRAGHDVEAQVAVQVSARIEQSRH